MPGKIRAYTFLTSLTFCLFPVAGAQENVVSVSEQPVQSEAYAQLKEKLRGLESFQANFAQTVVDAQDTLLQEANGSITLKQPDKMLWTVAEPNENTLIADGKTLWHIDPFVEQVVAMDQTNLVATNPVMLLTNPDGDEWQDYDVTVKGNYFVINSKDEGSQIVQLELRFDGATLTHLNYLDRQQQQSNLTFSDIVQNASVSEAIFIFERPPGYELDDQRN